MDPFAFLCCGANGSHCVDDADLPQVEHQEHFHDNTVVEVFAKCPARRNYGYLEEPQISFAGNYVDFEGNDLNFTINYPKNSRALPTEVHVGSARLSNLDDFTNSAHGHISLVVRAVLDSSMNGHMCACVKYFDAERILRYSRLTAKVVVLARHIIDEESVEYKGRIRSSLSSLQLNHQNKDKKHHTTVPRSSTVEELKNSERYRVYSDKLNKDGIFLKPRPAESNGSDRSKEKGFCIPSITIWPDVHDFGSLPGTSWSSTKGVFANHLNGVPAPRLSKSLDSSPAHDVLHAPDCHSAIFLSCESYQTPPSSVNSVGDSTPVPVVTILQEHVIRRTRSEERLSLTCSSSAAHDVLSLKERINICRHDLVEHLSERSQEWFCYTQRLWFRVKREYRIVSDGIQRMNRENR